MSSFSSLNENGWSLSRNPSPKSGPFNLTPREIERRGLEASLARFRPISGVNRRTETPLPRSHVRKEPPGGTRICHLVEVKVGDTLLLQPTRGRLIHVSDCLHCTYLYVEVCPESPNVAPFLLFHCVEYHG